MGKPSREKGRRHEQAVTRAFQDAGFAAFRHGEYVCDDISTNWLGLDRVVECKKRKAGFKQLYSWLERNDALVIGADYKPDLVLLTLEDFLHILGVAERGSKG